MHRMNFRFPLKTLRHKNCSNAIRSIFSYNLIIAFFREDQHANSLFLQSDRIKLTFGIFESDVEPESGVGGCGFELDELMKEDNIAVKRIFPIHDPARLQELSNKWYDWKSLVSMPMEDLRLYFGERTAFFFGWLQFYTKALILPALVGLAFFIAQYFFREFIL